MKKYILSLASIATILLFIGAGCAEANGKTLETSAEIQENDNPIAQKIEVQETDEESEIEDSDEPTKTQTDEKIKVNTNGATTPPVTPIPAVQAVQNVSKSGVQTEATHFESEDEDEDEDEDEHEDEDDNRQTNIITPPANNPSPAPAPKPTPQPAPAVKTYTLAEVQVANNQSKCWSIVSGSVYDLTPFTPGHPGGEAAILSMCGRDGTAAFLGQHSGESRPESTLAKFKIGILK